MIYAIPKTNTCVPICKPSTVKAIDLVVTPKYISKNIANNVTIITIRALVFNHPLSI